MLLLHALIEGVVGVLTASARHLGNDALACTNQRSRHPTIQLLALISDEQLGPRPISNDRNGRRRRRRSGAQALPQPPSVDPAASLQALASIFPAIATALAELIPGSMEADFARRIAGGIEQLVSGLIAIEEHPRVAELAEAAERGFELGIALTQQLAVEAAAGGLEDVGEFKPDGLLAERLRDFRTEARAALSFGLSLAEEGPAGAHEAFERYLRERSVS